MQYLKIIAITLLAAAPVAAGETVSHPQLGFRLTVPDGFVPDAEKVQGKVLFAFQRPPVGDQRMGTFVFVSRLDGILGREKLDPKQMTERNPQITIGSDIWKGFEIEVVRVPELVEDVQVVTFNAQTPLKPEAVMVTVSGEAARENDLREVLRAVLGNLEGQTNWLNTEQRVTRAAQGVAQLAISLCVLLFIGGLIWRVFRKTT